MNENRGADHLKTQQCTCRFCGDTFSGYTRRSTVCTDYACGRKYEFEKAAKQRERVNETNRLKRKNLKREERHE